MTCTFTAIKIDDTTLSSDSTGLTIDKDLHFKQGSTIYAAASQNDLTSAVTWSSAISSSGTQGQVAIRNGSGTFVNSGFTLDNTPLSTILTGQLVMSSGLGVLGKSSYTLPSAVGTTGKFLLSDGTNYGNSSNTFPTTALVAGDVDKVLVCSAAGTYSNSGYKFSSLSTAPVGTIPMCTVTVGVFTKSPNSYPVTALVSGDVGKVLFCSAAGTYSNSSYKLPTTGPASANKLMISTAANTFDVSTFGISVDTPIVGQSLVYDGSNFVNTSPNTTVPTHYKFTVGIFNPEAAEDGDFYTWPAGGGLKYLGNRSDDDYVYRFHLTSDFKVGGNVYLAMLLACRDAGKICDLSVSWTIFTPDMTIINGSVGFNYSVTFTNADTPYRILQKIGMNGGGAGFFDTSLLDGYSVIYIKLTRDQGSGVRNISNGRMFYIGVTMSFQSDLIGYIPPYEL
jgi:hypothetical protein